MTPWPIAHEASLSMEFSKQDYLSGLPFPSPGDLPNPGIKPVLQADSLPSELPGLSMAYSIYNIHSKAYSNGIKGRNII